MKILAIFLDMMGAEYLNYKTSKKNTDLDALLCKLGGTIFDNCYTPAPDTPRSSACMWSGCYPKKNKCNNRLKWPGKFIDDGLDNIWKMLNNYKYDVNIYMPKGHELIGLIPLIGTEHIYSKSIYEFLEQVVVSDNSFNFFYLPDLHLYLDEYSSTKYGLKKGICESTELINHIIDYYGTEFFDYIMIFSDHGFRLEDFSGNNYPVIHKDRIRTLMYLKAKTDSTVKIDSKLRSNMDLFPTIAALIGGIIENDVDGISLLDTKGHEYIMIEDHDSFSQNLGQIIEHWAVITNNGIFHWINSDGIWIHEQKENFNENLYERLLGETMSDFQFCRSFYIELNDYKKYRLPEGNIASSGYKIKSCVLFKWFVTFRFLLYKTKCYLKIKLL